MVSAVFMFEGSVTAPSPAEEIAHAEKGRRKMKEREAKGERERERRVSVSLHECAKESEKGQQSVPSVQRRRGAREQWRGKGRG